MARQERPGPVHLELPEDVLRTEAKGRPLTRCDNELIWPDRKSLAQIVSIIEEAERPLVLAGHGVVRAGACNALRDLVKRWNIPVIHTWFGAGVVPGDADQSLNTIGVRASDNAREFYERADLVLLAGYDMIEFQPQFWNIGAEKEVIYFGQGPIGHSEHLEPDVQVIGSLKRIFQMLAENAHMKQLWGEEVRDRTRALIEEQLPEGQGAKPQNAIRTIRTSLGREDIVVSDVGAHLIWLAKYYPVFRENTLLLDNGLISMGVGRALGHRGQDGIPTSKGGGGLRGWWVHDVRFGAGHCQGERRELCHHHIQRWRLRVDQVEDGEGMRTGHIGAVPEP